MLSLRELQTRFAASLFDEAPERVTSWIRSQGIDPLARIGIYRNNLQQGFLQTLALEFPVIQRLVGAEMFTAASGGPSSPRTGAAMVTSPR